MTPAKFVPRQRKRRILDRKRLRTGTAKEFTDSNALEIIPGANSEVAQKKAELQNKLRQDGVKVTSKKAKRLEKYIEKKLKKDENRELLARLAANKVDTSLFASSKSIGQAKETKRGALGRALKEKKAGLLSDDEKNELLHERRRGPVEDPLAATTNGHHDQREESAAAAKTEEAAQPTLASTPAVGSGLKRPLETDDAGRPVLAKKRKRGGIKTKTQLLPSKDEPQTEAEEEWGGVSSDGGQISDDSSAESREQKEEGSLSGGNEEEGSSSENEEDEGEDMDDGSDTHKTARKEQLSAFKAWAQQQRNKALGYEPAEPALLAVNTPKPASFHPRPLQQELLPQELQPTANLERKAYSVLVNRPPDVREARLQLPVVAEEQRIMEAIHNNDVVVVCGATGSGKTTQVPQFLFEAGYGSPESHTPGMIGVTQPRRVAAVSMSKRVSQELGDHGKAVAYQIRFEGTVDPKTAIKFMTDGVLLREVAQDITLRRYSAIIIDEAHERSVNTDILVGMLSRVVRLRAEMAREDKSLRPLKLIIMSATLRVDEFTQNPVLFSKAPPVLEVEGRQHPVTVHFARKTHHDYVEEAFRKISRGHKKLPPGGILVFLTGQNEIARLSRRLKAVFGGEDAASQPKVRIAASEAPVEAEDIEFGEIDDLEADELDDGEEDQEDDEDEFEIEDADGCTGPYRMHILPLYSLLPTKEQMRVFERPPERTRLVILATNVAETSLTIPGIRYVFDSGRSKERRYDRFSGVQSFDIGWISKASANQRSGRAGRTGPGHCYRLYSSAVYERDLPEFSDPELLRMPIEGVVLQLKAMNLQHVVNFPFPTPPDRASLAKAEKLLTYLSALSPEGKVTQAGRTMSIFPLSPRFARILLVGHVYDCLPYTIALVAGLSAAEVFVPENQAIPALTQGATGSQDEGTEPLRANADIVAEKEQAKARQAHNRAHKNFCFLDDKSDAIKLLQVVGEFAHEPTEQWCESHFVRYKVLKEIQQLRQQIVTLVKANVPALANLRAEDKLERPQPKQVQALKQMVAAGFLDQVAIRADKSPDPPAVYRKPRRAIDVPYLPLIPLDKEQKMDLEDRLVYIHPSSPLAHLSVDECPEYIVYAHLQRAGNTGTDGARAAKTRMRALVDVTGGQLAALAKGTPLLTYGKPIKEVKMANSTDTKREVWVVPYLRAEATGGLGWPLPARRVRQRKVAGKGWVVE